MIDPLLIPLVFFMTVLISLCPPLIPIVEAQDGCVTQKCHSTMLKGKSVHPGADPCEGCHEATDTTHPVKGKKTFKLLQEPPDLCYTCHDAFGTGEGMKLHSPVEEGTCTVCHNPHQSDQEKLLVQPMGDLCFGCHENNISDASVHGPAGVGSCTECHNPHQSSYDKLTVKEGEKLCFLCHADIQEDLKKGHVHTAVTMGCPSCHNPHSGPYKMMLPADGKDLCFQCHSDISDIIKKAKIIHPPIQTERSCVSCHSPHAGKTEKLTDKMGKDLCLECHKGIIGTSDQNLHGPIKQGACVACHDPHGTPNDKLLKKHYVMDYYAPYNDTNYELCFSCHDKELLRFPDTSFATNFRDGQRNLHYLHVNRKKKSRTCRFCHEPHSSKNPKLIRNYIQFEQWRLPTNFEKTETGGTCTPGCHKKVIYDRETPGKEPEKPPKTLPP